MIDAEMYGITPSPKTVDWLRLPPEKIDTYAASRPVALLLGRDLMWEDA